MASRPFLSVVIPVFNEAENVAELHRELTASLEPMGRPYEVLLVDDGSVDGTLERLLEIEGRDRRVRVLRLRRNFGQTAAFSAGFDHARGEVVVTSDGDLQNDPADIPKLIAEINQGADLVCGYRANRKDTTFKRIQSRIDPGQPIDKNLYDLPPAERVNVPSTPGSLDEALDALKADQQFLLKGEVFTRDVVETYISYKRSREIDEIRLRPHPYEFLLYYDV